MTRQHHTRSARCRPSTLAARLPAKPAAAGRARCLFGALPCDRDIRDDGRLLITEAVANVVEHTESHDVGVLLHHDPARGTLLCAVRDSSTRVPATPSKAGPEALDGRGLHLMEALADDWGYRRDEEGKWLWFVLGAAEGDADGEDDEASDALPVAAIEPMTQPL
jgi:anti-sigma regulatory factor (Ser/Thr protein kinase)